MVVLGINQSLPDRRARSRVEAEIATHLAAARASRLARENRQRFVERSLRNSAEAHGRSEAKRRFDTNCRGVHRDSGVIGTSVGLAILGVVAYALYTFVVTSGLLA